jgi:hypothetical protein
MTDTNVRNRKGHKTTAAAILGVLNLSTAQALAHVPINGEATQSENRELVRRTATSSYSTSTADGTVYLEYAVEANCTTIEILPPLMLGAYTIQNPFSNGNLVDFTPPVVSFSPTCFAPWKVLLY